MLESVKVVRLNSWSKIHALATDPVASDVRLV